MIVIKFKSLSLRLFPHSNGNEALATHYRNKKAARETWLFIFRSLFIAIEARCAVTKLKVLAEEFYDNCHVLAFDAYQKSKMMFCLCRRVESWTIIDTQIKLKTFQKCLIDESWLTLIALCGETFSGIFSFLKKSFFACCRNWFAFRLWSELRDDSCGIFKLKLSCRCWRRFSFIHSSASFPLSTHDSDIFLCKLSLWWFETKNPNLLLGAGNFPRPGTDENRWVLEI